MRTLMLAVVSTLALISAPLGADTLLVQRVKATAGEALPKRGETKAQVEARFGAPGQRVDPVGGDHPRRPAIHRWVYPKFTVYFERDRVIHAVVNKASASETGPKPASQSR